MSYYISTTITGQFEEVIDRVTEKLKEQGFGVLTEIDIKTDSEKQTECQFL